MPRARLAYLAATLLVVAAGTALRLVPVGLPAGLVKYGGSVLWGAMAYGLVGALLPGARTRTRALAALVATALWEALRLYSTPDLDAFRRTLAGQLLLGRVFSPWNILAYAAGILAAVALDRAVRARLTRRSGSGSA